MGAVVASVVWAATLALFWFLSLLVQVGHSFQASFPALAVCQAPAAQDSTGWWDAIVVASVGEETWVLAGIQAEQCSPSLQCDLRIAGTISVKLLLVPSQG